MADPEQTIKDQALMSAIASSDLDKVKQAVDNGANVNSELLPLHDATQEPFTQLATSPLARSDATVDTTEVYVSEGEENGSDAEGFLMIPPKNP